jgi:ketosteroid isomerase-like protein
MPDPFPPPVADWPRETAELVAQAVSDGDLDAALAQYEEDAPLRIWLGAGHADPENALADVMDLRLPVRVRIRAIMANGDVAVLICARHIAGTGPAGEPVSLIGTGCTVTRRQADGTWRISADVWCLS